MIGADNPPVNLRQVRKAAAREATRAAADANAARHGEPKAMRDTRAAEAARAARVLAAHRRSDGA